MQPFAFQLHSLGLWTCGHTSVVCGQLKPNAKDIGRQTAE